MKKSLGIIGVGAFGEFMLKHVCPYYDVSIYDANRDLEDVASHYNVHATSLDNVCKTDILILAVPVQQIQSTMDLIKDKLQHGQLIMDVASVKCFPIEILEKSVPADVDIVSLHPLFGPQSGRNGITGLNIAVINVRGNRSECVVDFLKDTLQLTVFETTAEEHDLQMAYVQGLTHMIAKVFKIMDLPDMAMQTKTFTLLREAINIVINDSDELFYAIQRDNPFVATTKSKFFDAVKELETKLQQVK